MSGSCLRAHELRLRAAFLRAIALVTSGTLPACASSEVRPPPIGDVDGGVRDSSLRYPQDAGASSDSGVDAVEELAFVACNDASAGAPYAASDAGTNEAGIPCLYAVDLACAPFAPLPGTCSINGSDCPKVCTLEGGLFDCEYTLASCDPLNGAWLAPPGQPVTITCGVCSNAGRRPAGFVRKGRAPATSALGRYFAEMAELEAASVYAFERLARELRVHRAPARLVRAARLAAGDEVRHTRAMKRLAVRYGGRPRPVLVRPSKARKLALVARENTVEGCVRETFGAVVASWQAAHARDASIRRYMTRIAFDETRHAALANAVAEWAEEHLPPREKTRIVKARRDAMVALARQVTAAAPPAALRTEAGVPHATLARALLIAIARELWGETA